MTIDTRPELVAGPPTPRRLLDIYGLMAYCAIGRTAAYTMLAPGGALSDDVVRVGRSIRIPIDRVDAWIDSQRVAERP